MFHFSVLAFQHPETKGLGASEGLEGRGKGEKLNKQTKKNIELIKWTENVEPMILYRFAIWC